MRLYKVYFQLYGKKMATKVMASSQESARQLVKDSIQFDKIEVVPPTPPKNDDPFNDLMDQFEGMFGKKS